MDPKLLGAYLFALLFDVAMPIALGIYARRKLGVSWRYFWYGALIFFLFQMITRVPAVQILQLVLAEPLRRSVELQWAWLFALALTAGLFEEVGRYLGYRYLVFRGSGAQGTGHKAEGVDVPEGTSTGGTGGRGDAENPVLITHDSSLITQNPEPRTQNRGLSTQDSAPSTQDSAWRKGVMYGLGHGGLESMLLVGGTVLLSLINALVVLRMDLSTIAALPPEQAEAVRQARVIFENLPWWMPLLGAFERLAAVLLQVAFSLLVLQVFLRGSLRWLYLAIGAHFLVDLVAVASVRWLGPVGVEGILAFFALGALYLIFRLKPEPEAAREGEATSSS